MINREKIRMLLGNESQVDLFIQTFREEARELIDSLHHHLQLGDLNQVEVLSHGLKGHLNYVGASDAAGLAQQIETLAEQKRPTDEISGLMVMLKDEVEPLLK